MKIIKKLNQRFKILLETERNGVHFSLLQNMGDPIFAKKKRYDTDLKSKIDSKDFFKDINILKNKGTYYVMWGPRNVGPLGVNQDYSKHGISSLNDLKGRKLYANRAYKKFFELVRNSDKQNFVFGTTYEKG